MDSEGGVNYVGKRTAETSTAASKDGCECLHYSILLVIATIFLCWLVYYIGYETGRIQRLKEHPGYVAPRGPALART